jgi:hypothetical protein
MIVSYLPRVLHSEDRQLIFAKYKTRIKMFAICHQGSPLRIVSETRKILNKAKNYFRSPNKDALLLQLAPKLTHTLDQVKMPSIDYLKYSTSKIYT